MGLTSSSTPAATLEQPNSVWPVSVTDFNSKVVRDLAWLICSPAVLSANAGMELLRSPGRSCKDTHATVHWLKSLDSDPEAILMPLREQQSIKRLGFYAAALTQYWLQHGPGWNTSKVLSSVQLSAAGDSKQTAGQLKLVIQRPAEALHVESSVKFFADATSTTSGVSECCTSCYVGPFLHENLAWRLSEARRKVKSTESGLVRSYLQRQFGELPVRSVYLLKGYIFKPFQQFFGHTRPLRAPPPELNAECLTGWYTTNITAMVQCLPSDSLLAVMPKLFWLSPGVATGNPPMIFGEDLPAQHEPVPVELPDKVQKDVQDHTARSESALLLCEFARDKDSNCAGGERWVERSRGFVLPASWDPKTLMTGGPQGMKSSAGSDARPTCENPSKWSNQRRKYSERLADTARQPAPSLAEAGVHDASPQLEEPLNISHLLSYVLSTKEPGIGCELPRFQQKLALRSALEEAEAAESGSACRLICAAVDKLTSQSLRTEGHFLLELFPKPSHVFAKPSMMPCNVRFAADELSLNRMFEATFSGSLCMRLAVKLAARFSFVPPAIPAEQLPQLFREATASQDRSRLAGLVEYLAAGAALQLDCSDLPLENILERLSSPPADALILELVCQAMPDVCGVLASKLTATGQLKLARRVEARRWRGTKHEQQPQRRISSEDTSAEVNLSDRHLLSMPPEIRVVHVTDPHCLNKVCSRLEHGGVVGVDAEWKPWALRGNDGTSGSDSGTITSSGAAAAPSRRSRPHHPVQLLQLAWSDIVYVIDMPVLHGDRRGQELLGRVLELLLPPEADDGDESIHCVPVGYGLEADILRVAESYPVLSVSHASRSWKGIDVKTLTGTHSTKGGLDHLCVSMLGLRMDKSMQCCNWEQRPFSPAQVQYAAMDAWVLLPLLNCVASTHRAKLGTADGLWATQAEVGSCIHTFADAATLASLSAVQSSAMAPLAQQFPSPAEIGVCAVARALRRLGVDDVNLLLIPDAHVSQEACSGVLTCKTLACVASNASDLEALLCLAVLSNSGFADLDLECLARAANRSHARLATPEELHEQFQQPRGGVGPIGPTMLGIQRPLVILDEVLTESGDLHITALSCGAGSPGWQLVIEPTVLLELTWGVTACLGFRQKSEDNCDR